MLTDGTTRGISVLIVDPLGRIVKKEGFGGVNIAVDGRHDSVWIVGADITRLNRNLVKQFSIDPIAWAVFCVDFASDGSAWVGESRHPEVAESQTRLPKVSITGNITKAIEMLACPFCLSVDRNDDSVWVVTQLGPRAVCLQRRVASTGPRP